MLTLEACDQGLMGQIWVTVEGRRVKERVVKHHAAFSDS